MDFFRDQAGFALAIIGGIIVSILASEKHSLAVASARIFAGLFCSIFLTDPTIDWLSLDSLTYRNAVAGLLAMTGYAVTRFVVNINKATVLELIRAIRGSK